MSTDTDVLVEEARRLVELAAGDALGDARLYLSGLTRQGDTTVCTFDYVLSGVPVVLPGRSAATVVFTGASMTDFHLLLKTYTQSTQTLHLLPPVQAAVLLPEGGRLTLLYQDSGTGTLTAGWRD